MYILFGKKNVRIFDFEKQTNVAISYKEFHENYSEVNYNKIIIDRTDIDFVLEHLKNCSVIDAYKILRCRTEVLLPHESIFLIRNDNFNLLKRNNFYIQKNTIDNPDFYKKINLSNGVFLFENVISEFCKRVSKIDENTWWLYIGEHQSSGIKFVAGVGNGIVFSRIIEQSKNFQEEIEFHTFKTLQYIKRFGFKDEIKIFSAIDNFVIKNQFIEIIDLKRSFLEKNVKNVDDTEYVLVDFFSRNKNVKTAFITENFFRYFLKNHLNKIFVFLFLCFFILGFWFLNIQKQIYDLKYFINQNEKTLLSTIKDSSKTFEAKIDVNNFEYIQYVTKFLKESKNPIEIFKKLSIIFQGKKIQIETLSMEKHNDIKLKCKLNKKLSEKLQKLSNDTMELNVTKSENQKTDYEIIDDNEDKNFGAEICIKLK